MTDQEKVIKGLEEISDYFFSVYHRSKDKEEINKAKNMCDAVEDTLTLLKKQEAKEPHYTTLKYLVNGTEVIIHHPECPRCTENGLALWDAEIEKGQAFCKRCGQAVKWK